MITVEGGCHCGHVRFEVRLDSPNVELLDCDCSVCTMTGYLHLIVPEERFRQTEGRGDLTLYRFGSGRARHLFCQHCGIKSFYRPRSHPGAISVNWRCLDEDHGLTATIVPFDGVCIRFRRHVLIAPKFPSRLREGLGEGPFSRRSPWAICPPPTPPVKREGS